jgi:ABC-type glycerol-3-phosphate transport system substrate-binding protein
MKRKRVFFIIGLIFIILFLFFSSLWYFYLRSVEPEGRITAFFHLYSSPAKEALETILQDFERKYPGVELDYYIEPYLDLKRTRLDFLNTTVLEKDHTVISVLTSSNVSENMTLSPGLWTGNNWKLYYNQDVLLSLDINEEELSNAAEYGLPDFLEQISQKLKPGQDLFSVSSKYYMQYLAWLQHLELERTSGKMPENFSTENWEKAVDSFNNLVSAGLINSDHGEINEASTAINMFKGKALFCLYTDGIYSIFLPGDRDKIKSIPFPGSNTQGWIVGSGFYLAVTEPEDITPGADSAVRTFIDYLRSEEVIDQMLREAGIKLNPPRTRRMVKEIPSISGRARDAELRPLIESLKTGSP